jgi:hypothetical protein
MLRSGHTLISRTAKTDRPTRDLSCHFVLGPQSFAFRYFPLFCPQFVKIPRRFLCVDHSTGLPKQSWSGTAFQASLAVILPSLCQLNGGSNDAGDGGNKLGAQRQ